MVALSEAFLDCKKKAERRSILLNSKEFHTTKADSPKILLTGPITRLWLLSKDEP